MSHFSKMSKWKKALDIVKIESKKDKIKHPHLCMADVFPRINDSLLAVGASGSGKSTVVAHLLTSPFALKGVFDRIFLFSPTGEADDIQKSLKLGEEDLDNMAKELLPHIPSVITDMSLATKYLQEIEASQAALIKEKGAHKAPLFAIYYDDFIGENEFMRTKEFMDSFILCRHFNMTTIACAQAYTGVPRKQRMQAKHIIYFKGNQTETDQIIEQYAPPGACKKTMEEIIKFATKDKFDFLYINKRSPVENRFRKGFKELIRFTCDDEEQERLLKKRKGFKNQSSKDDRGESVSANNGYNENEKEGLSSNSEYHA